MSKVSEGVDKAKAYASETVDNARAKAGDAVAATRRGAATAAEKASAAVQQNPLAILVGGLAVGVIAGALLPRTRREESLLGDVGRKVNRTATDAAKAAKTAGIEQLDSLGINKENAKSQFTNLVEGVVKAANSASDAVTKRVSKKD